MRSILLLPLLILSALPLAAIPSQKDALASAKRDAQGVYNIASRTKDQAKFLETIIRLQEVGAKISAANQQALGSIRPGYPADVKSKQAQQTWDRKIGDAGRPARRRCVHPDLGQGDRGASQRLPEYPLSATEARGGM